MESEADDNASSVAMLPPDQLSGELHLVILEAGAWRISYLEPESDSSYSYTGSTIVCVTKVFRGPSPLLDKKFGLRINRRTAKPSGTNSAALGEHTCNIDLYLEDGDFGLVAAMFAAGLLDKKDVIVELPFYPKPGVANLLCADIDQFSIHRTFWN